MSNLLQLYEKHKAELSDSEIWHIELALMLDEVPNYVFDYFNRFFEQEKTILVDTKKPKETRNIPFQIERWEEEVKRLHKERAYYHNELSHCETDEQRYALAYKLICEIQPAIEETYEKLNKYKESGIIDVPSSEQEVKQKVIDAFNRERKLRVRKTQLAAEYKKTGNPNKLEQLNKVKAELDDIRTFLHGESSK